MSPTTSEKFATLTHFADETPKIDDSHASITSENVFNTAWEIAQKHGFDPSSEPDQVSSQTLNEVFAEATQATFDMVSNMTWDDQSAILAVAEIQLMALTQPDIRLDIKESAMNNLRDILLSRGNFNPTVLDPIREATKTYLQSPDCPDTIKDNFADIRDYFAYPAFETITVLIGEIPELTNENSTHSAEEVFQIARSTAAKYGLNWSTDLNSKTDFDISFAAFDVISTVHDYAKDALAPVDIEARLADVEIQLLALTSSTLALNARISALRNLGEYLDDESNPQVSQIAENSIRMYLLHADCPDTIIKTFNLIKRTGNTGAVDFKNPLGHRKT